jgi:hypothetical protein
MKLREINYTSSGLFEIRYLRKNFMTSWKICQLLEQVSKSLISFSACQPKIPFLQFPRFYHVHRIQQLILKINKQEWGLILQDAKNHSHYEEIFEAH